MTEWLTIQQAAQRVGRSPSTIYRWVDQHGLPRLLGRIPVRELLDLDRKMRAKR